MSSMVWSILVRAKTPTILFQVHGDYSEDVGVKVDKAADEVMAEGGETEPVGA